MTSPSTTNGHTRRNLDRANLQTLCRSHNSAKVPQLRRQDKREMPPRWVRFAPRSTQPKLLAMLRKKRLPVPSSTSAHVHSGEQGTAGFITELARHYHGRHGRRPAVGTGSGSHAPAGGWSRLPTSGRRRRTETLTASPDAATPGGTAGTANARSIAPSMRLLHMQRTYVRTDKMTAIFPCSKLSFVTRTAADLQMRNPHQRPVLAIRRSHGTRHCRQRRHDRLRWIRRLIEAEIARRDGVCPTCGHVTTTPLRSQPPAAPNSKGPPVKRNQPSKPKRCIWRHRRRVTLALILNAWQHDYAAASRTPSPG